MEMIIEKNIFSFIQGYSLIAKGDCKHKSGKSAYSCYRKDVSSQSSCEDYCTSHIICVAYNWNIEANKYCTLYPSQKGCPSGFSDDFKYETIAASMNDLIATNPESGDVCYGKI